MCLALPGPRCSSHARIRLEGLKSRHAKSHKQLVEVAKERMEVSKKLQQNPRDKKLRRRHQTLSRQGKVLKSKVENLAEDVRLSQIDYDGTPDGQKELKAELNKLRESGATQKEILRVNMRISRGKAKNYTRKAQHALKQEEKKTGKTTRERRGDFIGMSDRNSGNTTIVLEEDLLTTAA